ncbi:hypothetical protein G3M48_004099 [Beauveria asiatica]|uniref:Uncharacterized protein n=1 Tax=Beauveria asiatica TaxID=1069075 RepID=A0AAW0RV10_9HYPO
MKGEKTSFMPPNAVPSLSRPTVLAAAKATAASWQNHKGNKRRDLHQPLKRVHVCMARRASINRQAGALTTIPAHVAGIDEEMEPSIQQAKAKIAQCQNI